MTRLLCLCFLKTEIEGSCDCEHCPVVSMVDLQPQLEIGARCLVAGKFFATIRYVGPVEGQSGDWVGLEWDDICRGKHDGSHDGRRYFECNRGRSSGSFVRLSKFVKAVEFGSSLIQAVQRRYSDRSAAQEQVPRCVFKFLTGTFRHISML